MNSHQEQPSIHLRHSVSPDIRADTGLNSRQAWMVRIAKTVFISYRRTNVSWALAISQSLTHSGYDVFIDISGIDSGHFERAILENVRSHAHFLVLLTPSALEHVESPADWLRREVETALDAHRNIVPIMLDGFQFNTPSIASRLIGPLAELPKYNGLTVPAEFFEEAMTRLRERYLNVEVPETMPPVSEIALQAVTDQQKAVAARPRVNQQQLTAENWFERGFEATDPEEEIRSFSEAIRLEPRFAEAFYNRAIARSAMGDRAGALADYDEAIRLSPEDPDAYNNRGLERSEAGDRDGALADLDLAVGLLPTDAEVRNNRGLVRSDSGDLSGAIEDYTAAIRITPDLAGAYINRGAAHRDFGDPGSALTDLNEALRLAPLDADAYYNRGLVKEDSKHYRAAAADYERYLELGGGTTRGERDKLKAAIRRLRRKTA